MRFRVRPGGCLTGSLRVPGDKSISHRALMIAAVAEGDSEIRGLLPGEDVRATRRALEACGVVIDGDDAHARVHGRGPHSLRAPAAPLDLGNSGTSMRLLTGLFAGLGVSATLVGDASLMRRPMRRVVEPLRRMGARVSCDEADTPPVRIDAGPRLRGAEHVLPVASAQVKSALLLAGVFADGRTCVREPAASRNHTELMLTHFGCPVAVAGTRACVEGGARLAGRALAVPGDLSSAAFFMVGAAIAAGSQVRLEGVGVNPTRTGIIDLLRAMGARVDLLPRPPAGREPVADIEVRPDRLTGIEVPPELVPRTIDEIPALLVAAACAAGRTVVRGAAELRVKESDRIAGMAAGLAALGVEAQPAADGILVQGGRLRGGVVDSLGDHRLAMAFAIAALRAEGPVEILDCAPVATSFPGFAAAAAGLGLDIEVLEE